MEFNESFFLPETRLDFHIKSMMKRYWASNMESLAVLDKLCKKHNIKYFADYGTLLGAVRHKGYIPWDDDIDVSMLRIDYERFIKIAQKELPEPFMLYNVKQSMLSPMRLINGMKIDINEDFLKKFHLCPYSSGIDIYVLDKIPTDESEKEVFKILYTLVRWISQTTDPDYAQFCDEASFTPYDITDEDIEELINEIETLTKQTIDRNKPISPQLAELTHNLSASYYQTNSPEVANMQSWLEGGSNSIDINCFNKTIDAQFENMTIQIPEKYDEVLIKRFGPDYMTPINQVASHNYPGYKSQEEKLFAFLEGQGIPVPEYMKI